MTHALGVCSWSLRPDSEDGLGDAVRACGLGGVQLALDPLRRGEMDEPALDGLLEVEEIAILSGMMEMAGEDYTSLESIARTGGVRPDETWETNRAAAEVNADTAHRLGVGLVTFHAGFIPHDPADPERATMLARLREMAEIFGVRGVRVALETGQETAETLAGAMDELGDDRVGINFDPANMILYGKGDPVDALRRLSARIVQVHVKDAVPSSDASSWGAETPVGAGAVDWGAFFGVVRSELPGVPLVIEREAGDSRIEDVRAARVLVESHLA